MSEKNEHLDEIEDLETENAEDVKGGIGVSVKLGGRTERDDELLSAILQIDHRDRVLERVGQIGYFGVG